MWLVIAAWVASLLVFSTFFMKTMIPLRVAGIASNVAFMSYALLGLAYGVFGRLYPILVLHACLLPLNVIRLRQVRRLVQAVHSASDNDALEALVPYMKTESHAAGDVLFRRGDRADKLYMVQRGRVLFSEMGKDVAAGAVFGEVGLVAAGGTRSLTAVCEDDCQLSTITKEKALELYYQNPTFGMFLLRLVSGYALDHAVAGGPTE
jgi:CRP/FNR family transcriptional regulator, cyclic AMP receptor protein